MKAVFKKEFKSYFNSVLGYVYLAVFYFFASLYFFLICLTSSGTSNLSYVFQSLFSIVMFLIPILTMRIWSEDKKQKTDQLLLTAPVGLFAITMGKYLAALAIFVIGALSTILFAVISSFLGSVAWTTVLLCFLGIVLLGATLIAIGMFLSSLTENQLISAVITLGINLVILMLPTISSVLGVDILSTVIDSISFSTHFQSFIDGILNIADIVFFISIPALFIFLNIRVLEKRRWA